MIENDRQHGKPARLYRDTKANIAGLGLGAADEGCVAYATDTNEFGTFDGAAWAWSIHDLLGTRHGDTTTDAVTRGSIIVGSSIPAWDELPIGGAHQILKVSAGATDPVWTSFDWDDIAAGAAADMVHDHSAAAEGGQLDWDTVWSDAIHDHSANSEGGDTLGFTTITGAGVDVPDGWCLGIGPALERIVFDAAGDICVMGAKFGVGLLVPTNTFTAYDDVAGYVAKFINDGDNVNRHGIEVQCGADDGAAVGDTIYFAARDGDGGWTGVIKTIDGAFQLVDISDERRKANIVDTKINGLDIVNGLRVRDFNWKGHLDDPVMTSFIAQEAQEVFPAMVSDFGDGTLGTSRAMLIPILTKAIQELDARLTKGGM